jgi:hypothetical protein
MGDKASLFILAVGRDSLKPFAQQKVLLRDITFPYAFEVRVTVKVKVRVSVSSFFQSFQ